MTPSLIRHFREPVKLLGAGVGHRDQDSDEESVEDVLLEVPHDVNVRDPEGLGVDSQLAEGDAHRLRVALDHLDQVVPETKEFFKGALVNRCTQFFQPIECSGAPTAASRAGEFALSHL